MVMLLLACASDPNKGSTEIPEMDAVDLTIRMSLDLRGVRPSVAEIEQVEANPSAADDLAEQFLADPRFEQRIKEMYTEVFLTRSESYFVSAASYGLSDQAAFAQAIGEEVPRMVAYVAANDLPYTDLVTADWTMANEILGYIWPIDYPEGSSGWQVAHYTDGRPAAGILSTNAFHWRYTSTDSNANRKRANAVSRTLLCNDYLTRPIEFDRNVNLLDEAAVEDALHNNPGCVACHNSLDPFASYFFGFWWYTDQNADEMSTYHTDRELLWKDYTGASPAFYGVPGDNLRDLGLQIAADSRYPQCAVETAWELLLRREAAVADTDVLISHRNAFIEGGLTLKNLYRSILTDPRYRAGDTDAEGYVPRKMMSPDQLASAVEDLTGFHWSYANYELLQTDSVGFRTLAGGADGYNVTAVSTSPNATLLLVQERLSELAARYVVESEPERLFTIDFTETPDTDPEAMAAQIQALHLRIFGNRVAADGEEVTANLALWSDLYTIEGSTQAAWAGLLSALLRDPDFLLY